MRSRLLVMGPVFLFACLFRGGRGAALVKQDVGALPVEISNCSERMAQKKTAPAMTTNRMAMGMRTKNVLARTLMVAKGMITRRAEGAATREDARWLLTG